MRSTICLSALVLLGFLAVAPQVAEAKSLTRAAASDNSTSAEGLPLFIMNPPIPAPVWVDVRIALKEDGTLARDLFHPSSARDVQELLDAPLKDGCVHVGTVWEQYAEPQPRDSLEAAAKSAQTVVVGRVVGQSHGFYGGIAGTIFAIEPTERIKGELKEDRYFLIVPVGTFTLGGKTICKSDDRFAALPSVEDEVVVLTVPPVGEHKTLLLVRNPGDFVSIHGGKVELPSQYRAQAREGGSKAAKSAWAVPDTREGLLATLRSAAQGAPK